MRKIIYGSFTVYVSDDLYKKKFREITESYAECRQEIKREELVERTKELLFEKVQMALGSDFEEGSKFRTYIDRFRRGRKCRLGVLVAHGDVADGSWVYLDGETREKIQEWVDKRDGRYACIFVLCCNPGSLSLVSKNSLLVFADRDVNAGYGSDTDDRQNFSLIHPKEGEINDYIIDYHLRKKA